MPPKPHKPVDLSESKKPKEAQTVKVDHSQRASYDFGEQGIITATVPYGGTRRSVNCTVNAPELQAGIAKQKADCAKVVASHQAFRRVPKGERKLKHKLPLEEEYLPDGDVKVTRPSTSTRRMEH